jgi:NAD+ kinase
MKRILTVIRDGRPRAESVSASFTASARSRGFVVGHDVADADVVVAVGGDGTMLGAAATAMAAGIPVCGVNVGRVGYLAEFEPSEIDDLVQALANDTFTIHERGTVGVQIGDRTITAVNDVVVEKVISQRIIEIAVTIDGEKLATYRADGIIVASPIGSTAYNLSAGGPVIAPDLDAMVLTPVAPHSLVSRAIVVGPHSTIDLTTIGTRPATLNVDGREIVDLPPDTTVRVSRGPSAAQFLTLNRHPFPYALREQFGLDHA